MVSNNSCQSIEPVSHINGALGVKWEPEYSFDKCNVFKMEAYARNNELMRTFKKIFGEVWLTDQVKMKNDLGVFRACKMQALHKLLFSVGVTLLPKTRRF